jgi:hypothetical protein
MQVYGFLWLLWLPPLKTNDHHDINEILVKVALVHLMKVLLQLLDEI